jgi:hypothetical protein
VRFNPGVLLERLDASFDLQSLLQVIQTLFQRRLGQDAKLEELLVKSLVGQQTGLRENYILNFNKKYLQ